MSGVTCHVSRVMCHLSPITLCSCSGYEFESTWIIARSHGGGPSKKLQGKGTNIRRHRSRHTHTRTSGLMEWIGLKFVLIKSKKNINKIYTLLTSNVVGHWNSRKVILAFCTSHMLNWTNKKLQPGSKKMLLNCSTSRKKWQFWNCGRKRAT